MDNREDYGYGWNEKGKRFHDLKSGKRSIMSGLCQGKLIAPLTFEGACNRSVFEKWLSEQLLPELSPGQILILDNATFDKGERIRELVESVGCELQQLDCETARCGGSLRCSDCRRVEAISEGVYHKGTTSFRTVEGGHGGVSPPTLSFNIYLLIHLI